MQISKLQRIQNSAARLVKRTSVRQPISPILQELHRLPVKQRIKFKILLLTFQCLSGIAPSYLQELIQMYTPARGGRSFSVCSSRLVEQSAWECQVCQDYWKIQTCSQNSFVHSLELLLCLSYSSFSLLSIVWGVQAHRDFKKSDYSCLHRRVGSYAFIMKVSRKWKVQRKSCVTYLVMEHYLQTLIWQMMFVTRQGIKNKNMYLYIMY